MEICLAKGELIRLDGGKSGIELRCPVGLVWVTKGDGADYLISGGKRIMLDKGESALVEALEASEMRLRSANHESDMVHPAFGLAGC